MSDQANRQRPRPQQLALVLGAGASILLLSLGIRQTFGLFVPPMSESLGWSTGTIATTIALQNLFWGLCQPFASMIADRFGTVRVLIAGGCAYAAGIVITAFPVAPLQAHLGLGVLVGVGISATSFPVVLGAVARAAPTTYRNRALGLASAGGSFGQFLLVPVTYGALDVLSWVGALIFMALLAGLMVPLAAGMASGSSEPEDTSDGLSLGGALREAFHHSGYWLLCLGFFVCGFHIALILAHFPAFLELNAFSPQWAALTLGLIGFFNIPGTYLAGWLGERYRQKRVLSALYLFRAVLFAGLLLLPMNHLTTGLFSALLGLSWLGTVPLTSGLVGRIFGPRYVTTLFGITFMSHQIGAFFGARSAGVIVDRMGNYELAWALSIVLALISAVVHMPIADHSMRTAKCVSS